MEADDCKLLSSSWKLSQGLYDADLDHDADHPKNDADDADGDDADDADRNGDVYDADANADDADADDADYADDADGNGDADDESQALETYKAVHRRFPDNVECLKFLVRL